MNVGSGGGAAPAAAAAASGDAPAAEAAKEEKVEGKATCGILATGRPLTILQIRRSPMRIWASVFSIKRVPGLVECTYHVWPRLLAKSCNIGLVRRAL